MYVGRMKMNSDSHMHKTTEDDTDSESLADVFGFLALLMRYPEPTFFDNDFLDLLEALLTSLNFDSEKEAIACWRTSVQDVLLDAQVEYTRLFINAAPHVIAPPYAAVYLDGDKTLQGKSTEKTRDFYREHGFDLKSETEPADHIQFELEFLSCLFREKQFEAAEIFLHSLFRPWFNTFQHRVLEENRHPLYRVSLQLITFFTKEEQ